MNWSSTGCWWIYDKWKVCGTSVYTFSLEPVRIHFPIRNQIIRIKWLLVVAGNGMHQISCSSHSKCRVSYECKCVWWCDCIWSHLYCVAWPLLRFLSPYNPKPFFTSTRVLEMLKFFYQFRLKFWLWVDHSRLSLTFFHLCCTPSLFYFSWYTE